MRAGRAERNSGSYEKSNKSSTVKVLLLVMLALAVAAAGVAAYMYKSAKDSISLDLSNNDFTIEFGENSKAMDYVSGANGDVTASEEMLDTSSLGEKELVYTVTKPVLGGLLRPSEKYVMSYTVVDTKSPVKLWSANTVTLPVGGKFSLSDYVAYGDNADPEPKLECSGSVDTDNAGSYPLHITVSDASGNRTEWDITVNVLEEMPEYEDEDVERTQFADFVKANAGEGRSLGIDVSSWQNEIDFEAVKNAGCEFVIIRVGFTTGDYKIAELDYRFSENLEKAKAAGLKTGVYLYSDDNDIEQARASADWVIEQLDGTALDLPVVFDWEDFGRYQTYKMNFTDLNRMYDAFADEISKAGYECMLYSSRNYLEDVWEDTDKRPVWLAHYTEKTDYEGPYRIWQASCTGTIDGISGAVDMDILYEQ